MIKELIYDEQPALQVALLRDAILPGLSCLNLKLISFFLLYPLKFLVTSFPSSFLARRHREACPKGDRTPRPLHYRGPDRA